MRSGRRSQPWNSSSCSLSCRVPAPSETTAASSSVSAAAWSISSPPTERPIPPILPGSTSGRVLRNSIAARMSLSRTPAEQVAVALALALAAAVEEQDPVAVAGEHARVRLRAAAAGEGDHGGAVLRGHVPALELEAVARPERDVLVRGAEVGRGHGLPHDVRDDVAESERRDGRVRQDRARRRRSAPGGCSASGGGRSACVTARASRSRRR